MEECLFSPQLHYSGLSHKRFFESCVRSTRRLWIAPASILLRLIMVPSMYFPSLLRDSHSVARRLSLSLQIKRIFLWIDLSSSGQSTWMIYGICIFPNSAQVSVYKRGFKHLLHMLPREARVNVIFWNAENWLYQSAFHSSILPPCFFFFQYLTVSTLQTSSNLSNCQKMNSGSGGHL